MSFWPLSMECSGNDYHQTNRSQRLKESRSPWAFSPLKMGPRFSYKDSGSGEPIFFHHGWPLSADDWDAQMMFFLDKGYRQIIMIVVALVARPKRSWA